MNKIFLLALVSLVLSSCTELSRKETFILYGCTDSTASNYSDRATESDGSCEYVYGCTDINADNYNPNATTDDNSCVYTSYVVIYSSGKWANSSESPYSVEVNNEYNTDWLGTIQVNSAANYSNSNCKDISSNSQVLKVQVTPGTTVSYTAILRYTVLVGTYEDYRERIVNLSISIPTTEGSCTFYDVDE